MKPVALVIIRLYQRTLSPVLPLACRYEPTCSAYAYEAVARFGVVRGGWLALRRLARCTPGRAMRVDPVPSTERRTAA